MSKKSNAMTDAELAAKLAYYTGRILLNVRESGLIDGKSLGKAGDEAANKFLCHVLRHARPDDGLLSEEEKDNLARLDKQRVWIIDPVDGTREYGEERDDWAVHVGLSINGKAKIGAVALPSLDLVLRTDQPEKVPGAAGKPRLVVSRTRPATEAVEIARRIDGELVEMGSAGAKAMAVVRGEAEIYLHSGGQFEWDSCAPVAVAQAHGLHCSRIDGSPLHYNNANTFLADLLICHRQDAKDILDIIKTL